MPDPAPPDLPRAHVFITALAAVCAVNRPPPGVTWPDAHSWLASLLRLLQLDREALPSDVPPEDVAEVAAERDTWTVEEQDTMARALVQAALAPEPTKQGKGKDKEAPKVAYTPSARAAAHSTLDLLGLDAGVLLPRAEVALAAMLAAAVGEDQAAVDEARKKQKDGWGGVLGRRLEATAGGFIAGGVLLGVTGGLAAPAIIALLAPLGLGAALSGIAAPVVLGTLFGLTGGGLAGRRVSQRWRGVDEFAFVEVGAHSKPTKEEVEDLRKRQGRDQKADEERVQGELLFEAPEEDDDDSAARREVERSRRELEDKLNQLSLSTEGKEVAQTPPETPKDVVKEIKDKVPSLTATIVVPGLLNVSRLEAITAWRAICSPELALPFTPRRPTAGPGEEGGEGATTGFKDGRDVYVLRYETETMLSTGRDVESWVMTKVKTLAATQAIKMTVLSAYYAAVALPISVFKLSTMALDNTWMGATNKAVKAGRLLGEVLAQRVQGERPVVLIGTSVGALTVLHALLYLSSLPASEGGGAALVDSVYLVSLPSAPTPAEWAAVRRVTARRVVNAWSGSDFVLASVVRLHEVVSRGVTGNNGTCVAGLGPVAQPGVEDMDLSDVLRGHNEINMKMGEVLQVLEVDD